MSEIQKLPECRGGGFNGRVETGPVQFGDDWPGTFIRGDNAIYFAMCLDAVLRGGDRNFEKAALAGLLNLLRDSDVRNHPELLK